MKRADADAITPVIVSALADGDYRRAWEIVYKIEASQTSSRGMGIDWSKPPLESFIEDLRNICEAMPPVLSHIPADLLWQFRLPVALSLLLGIRRELRLIPPGIDTGCHLDYAGIASTISGHARRLREMPSMIKCADDFPVFEICSTVDDRMCAYCRSMHGRLFWAHQLDLVPPFASCTCPTGCRCMGVKTTTFRLGRKAELIKCPACAGVIVVNPDTVQTECRSCGQPVALT